jgi:hypothetical protein
VVWVVTQVAPLQQPEQEVVLQAHCPLVQAWPLAQATQAAPPVPQVAAAEVWHCPLLSQQPLGHEAASHTHLPWALHSWWVAQAAHEPPLAPQVVFDAVTQVPFEQHPLQLVPPQLQAPPLQAWPEEHAPQAFPPEPQALVDCADVATQLPPVSQQPFGHEAGVQTQVPEVPQVCPLWQLPHAAPAAPQVPLAWLA